MLSACRFIAPYKIRRVEAILDCASRNFMSSGNDIERVRRNVSWLTHKAIDEDIAKKKNSGNKERENNHSFQNLKGLINQTQEVGFFITTARSTTEAERFAREAKVHIKLING